MKVTDGLMSWDDAVAAEQVRRGPQSSCWHQKFEKAYPENVERLAALIGEVVAGERTVTSVVRILERVGFKVSTSSVGRHIRNACECRRGE